MIKDPRGDGSEDRRKFDDQRDILLSLLVLMSDRDVPALRLPGFQVTAGKRRGLSPCRQPRWATHLAQDVELRPVRIDAVRLTERLVVIPVVREALGRCDG